MIQLSKPRRPFNPSVGVMRNNDQSAPNAYVGPSDFECRVSLYQSQVIGLNRKFAVRRKAVQPKFEPGFFRNETGYIPSDAQSIRSQATFASGVPSNLTSSALSSYAGSTRGFNGTSIRDDDTHSIANSSVAYSQADRLSHLETDIESQYKAGDDDETKSVISTTTASSQATTW